ncbi:MAG TPA: MFS transporter [Thermoanaerobaculia bacterium]|nr:MFS transporter [Thermoanaerobaculia bacterium]
METRKRLKPQVILLGLISLLNDSASEMIYPLLPVFLTSTLGATPLIVGMIEGTADGLASILKLAAGWISDRMPRRKPLVVGGYALAAASRALIAAAGAWPLVLTARLIDRTGKGIRSAPRDALIADVTAPGDRGRAFGFQRALDHTGAVVGPLIALVLLNVLHLEMRTIFYIAVIPGAVGVVMLLLFLKEERREHQTTQTINSKAKLPKRFWAAIGAIALFGLANSSDAYLILRAHAAGVATAMLPLLWAAHHVIKSLFSTRAGALSDRVDRRWLLVAGWSSYAVIYFIFPFARTMGSFFALFVFYAIPFTLSEGAERAWIGDLVPTEARGKSFGWYYLANGVCVLAGTALFGELYERVSPAAAFRTGGALALAAALWVVAMRRGSRTMAA